jgi:hypothetical protein
MMLKPRFAVSMLVVLVAGISVAGLSVARAADPGFCRPYARAALTQVRGGWADPGCAGHLRGARWSTEFSVHYEWCLGASPEAAGAERDARTRHLKACVSG